MDCRPFVENISALLSLDKNRALTMMASACIELAHALAI